MKYLAPLLVGVIILLGGGALYARAYTQAHVIDPLQITLEEHRGTVEYHPATDTNWKLVSNSQVFRVGDRLRTGEDGFASIIFYGRSTARLAANTELEISAGTGVDSGDESRQDVHLEVFKGNVWSRILKLLDVGSAYTVSHGDVVATVRGTAFNFSVATEATTTIDVMDSVVEIKHAGQSMRVSQGSSAHISLLATSTTALEEAVTSTEIALEDQPWFTDNSSKDKAFVKEAADEWEARDKQRKQPKNLFLEEVGKRMSEMMGEAPRPRNEQLIPPPRPEPPVRKDSFIPMPELPIQEQPKPPILDKTLPLEKPLLPPTSPVQPVLTPTSTRLVPLIQPPSTLPPQPAAVIQSIDVAWVSSNDNGDVQFSAIAHYSDRTTKDVTQLAIWAVVTRGGGTISGKGFLTLPPVAPSIVYVSASFEGVSGQGSVAVLTQ